MWLLYACSLHIRLINLTEESCFSGLAPFWSKILTMFKWPAALANCSGVHPDWNTIERTCCRERESNHYFPHGNEVINFCPNKFRSRHHPKIIATKLIVIYCTQIEITFIDWNTALDKTIILIRQKIITPIQNSYKVCPLIIIIIIISLFKCQNQVNKQI